MGNLPFPDEASFFFLLGCWVYEQHFVVPMKSKYQILLQAKRRYLYVTIHRDALHTASHLMLTVTPQGRYHYPTLQMEKLRLGEALCHVQGHTQM